MRRLIALIFLPLIFSCEGKKVEQSQIEFSYSTDTVWVDSKDLLLTVDAGLRTMTLAPDDRYLFFYNAIEKRLDKIDLDTYKIERSIQFASDGPNGIGSLSLFDLHVTNQEDFYFSSFDGIRKMDSTGNRLKIYNWDVEEFVSKNIPAKTIASFSGDYDSEGNFFAGVYGVSRGGRSSGEGLVLIDLLQQTSKTLEVPLLKTLEDFKIVLEAETNMTNGDEFHLQLIDDRVLISISPVNVIAIYDLKTDSLYQKSYATALLPAAKPGNFPRKVNSMDALKEAVKTKFYEPTFGKFTYDPISKTFFRFSYYQKETSAGTNEQTVVLSVFDQELNLIYELDKAPNFTGNVFFREGYIHKGINQNDELGFVRLKPNLNDE
ncbi:DUF4221 family protein [Algoriphagus sp.]|uniref:DUF4221 family protein n=1 Tax=Algoriphagus sp. TaxID=1872435 RepID=UPI002715BC44|nr:DUF4221 family protein [Algoriphagus sp.]MDO8967934.1 DUF4221 family protein [Algoriphagus sp.]